MPSSDKALRLDNQLCFALYRASRALTRAYTPLLEPLGLTYPQYLVLLVLWEEDDLTVSALGERLSLDSGTLTPLLKRLEVQGSIARHRDSTDERVVRIQLTQAGKNLKSQARHVPPAIACSAGFDGALPDDLARLQQLREGLCILTDDLDRTREGGT